MSCLLVALGTLIILPSDITPLGLALCTTRDLILLSVHLVLIMLFGNDPCVYRDSGITIWIMNDIIMTSVRLIRTPLQYAVNKRQHSNSSPYDPCVICATFICCGNLFYILTDWLSYFSWLI